MKSCFHCSNGSCPLLRELEKATDLYAFLNEHYPINIVLDNMHEASKASLVCTCCIFGNALQAIPHKISWWKRIKKVFKKGIISWILQAGKKILTTIFDLIDYLEKLPKKARITFCIMVFFILVLFGLVVYLSFVTHMQNKHIDWIDWELKHFL